MRRTGWVLGGAAVVLAAGFGGALLLQSRLDMAALRQSVIASVERQSGRNVRLGQLEVRLLPTPRIEASDVALGDRPGAAEPDMLRIGHLRAGIGIWPLLRHVVRLDGLMLDDVTLHGVRDADGHGNWEMGSKPGIRGGTDRVGAGGAGAGGAGEGGARWGIELGSLRIREARISWRDGLLHRGADVHLSALSANGLQGDRPGFDVAGEQGSAGYTLHGTVGPVRRLFDGGDRRTEWPVSVQATETIGGAQVGHGQVDGTIADPVHGRGYDVVVTASMRQLADLDRLFVHAGLPRIDGLEVSARVGDAGHPALRMLRASAGATEVAGYPDAALHDWSLEAADLTAPLRVAASGSWRGRTLVLKGSVASLQAVNAMLGEGGASPGGLGNMEAVPVQVAVGVGKSAWRVNGTAGAGESDLRLQGFVPDVGEMIGRGPDVGAVTVGARLQTQLGTMFRLSELQLASAAGDLEGAVSLVLKGRPTLTGSLESAKLDGDRLARWHGAAQPDGSAGPAHAQAGGRPSAPAAPAGDAALPWPLLRIADGDVSFRVGDLLLGGAHYTDFFAHAVLRQGRLVIDPVQAAGAAGAISARLEADAAAAPPAVQVSMRPVMLPAELLLRLLGAPDVLHGPVEVVGELQATGASREALAASASGHVGLSMTGGEMANVAMSRVVGSSSALAAVLPRGGDTAIRCLALHATLGGGDAMIDTMGLRTGRLSVDGHGRVGLGDGALDLHLVPDVSVGAAWASVPVRLAGTLRDPRPLLDAAQSGGRYALTIGSGGGAADCDAPLRAAREGVAGAAAPLVTAGATGKRKAPKPIDILRGLGIFR